ncbi:Na+ dependent nucleoside transporter N-terminal domain-containing protein, partial [Vibrio cholerae]
MAILFGIIGVTVLILCAYLLSESRSAINWKT